MTQKRTPKCSHCHRPAAELDSRRLCASCATEADAVADAYRYAKIIESVAVTVSDRWAIHSTVDHMCYTKAGNATAAPLIWQAVADKIQGGEQATYTNVCKLARDKAHAMGLNISVY
jgi:hypothetical protein